MCQAFISIIDKMDIGTWDVVVVGAGPSGSQAAMSASLMGARTLLLDRAVMPRYKTCGGGLTGRTVAHLSRGGPLNLPPGVPVHQSITRVQFTNNGARPRVRYSSQPIMFTTNRAEFDEALVRQAESGGVEFRSNTLVQAIDESPQRVSLRTPDGVISAHAVVGADGSAGRLAHRVGATYAQIDLGLEVELAALPGDLRKWNSTISLDWGPVPGSYGWVFPKKDTITVGVIGDQRYSSQLKEYLREYLVRAGLGSRAVIRDSGHLTKTRMSSSCTGSGRILLAGDALGVVEPWTREGISNGLISGSFAGVVAAKIALSDDPETPSACLQEYSDWVESTIQPGLTVGRQFLRLFSQHRTVVHELLSGTKKGWHAFEAISRGEKTMVRALEHPSAHVAVGLLAHPKRWPES